MISVRGILSLHAVFVLCALSVQAVQAQSWTPVQIQDVAGTAVPPFLWLDGEYVRTILADDEGDQSVSHTGQFSPIVQTALGHLLGIRFVRPSRPNGQVDTELGQNMGVASYLDVALYFDQKLRLTLQDPVQGQDDPRVEWKEATKLENRARLRGVVIPHVVRVHLYMNGSKMQIISKGTKNLKFLVRLPLMPDEVDLRKVGMDLDTGEVALEAGVLLNQIDLRANVDLGPVFKGVDTQAPQLDVEWINTILVNLGKLLQTRPRFLAVH